MGALGEPVLGGLPVAAGAADSAAGGDAGDSGRRVVRSNVAAYVIQGLRLIINFGARVALAHLILPEPHAVYEQALRYVLVASALRDLGLPFHLVREPRQPYGTVFVWTVVSGSLWTALVWLAAPAAGALNPEVPAVLRAMAIWLLLDGLAVAPRAFFERQLEIGKFLIPEIGRALLVAALAIGLATVRPDVWALVWAELAGAAFFAVALWLPALRRLPWVFPPGILRDLLRQSFWLFAVWVMVQLVNNIDIFIVEWAADTATVGYYFKAYGYVYLAATLAYPRALFPALVLYADNAERFFTTFRLASVQLVCVQAVAGYVFALNAALVVRLLLGSQWGPSAPILALLAFVPFWLPILCGELLKARHEDRFWLLATVLNLISLVGAGVFLTRRWGAPGMAVANYLLAGNLLYLARLRGLFGDRFGRLLRDWLFLYLSPLPLFGLVAWLCPAGWWRLIASGVAAILSVGIVALAYRGDLRSFMGRTPPTGETSGRPLQP